MTHGRVPPVPWPSRPWNPRRRFAALLRPVLPAAAVLALGGCAVGNYGALAGHVSTGQGARVFDVYSLGGHLRTRSDDAGLGLGFSRRTYVFPGDIAAGIADGWHYLWVPVPVTGATALDQRAIGVDVNVSPPTIGVQAGYHATTILSRIAADSEVVLELDYESGNPAATRLKFCRETFPC